MYEWCEFEKYQGDIQGQRRKFDNTIYTFDIETTSYLILDNKIIPGGDYEKLAEKEQEMCEFHSCMYIWQFSINNTVYYGRTWEELKLFWRKLDNCVPYKKIVFIHNLAFEFQYLKSQFHFKEVNARKSHKVMNATLKDYKIEFKCSYMMSNCALKYLPDLFHLNVEKMVGDLDYDLIRTPATKLSEKELVYCKNDCLVVYEYIKRELETYEFVTKIPGTSTGHVRNELKEITMHDARYKRNVGRAINTNPIVYNRLLEAFQGGYTHSCWVNTDKIIENVDSYDFTSSYPYVMVTHRFPCTEFRKCTIKSAEEINRRFCYLLVVKFTNLKCKYFNNFISVSKCRNINNGTYDNGRVMSADSLEITLTEVDFLFLIEAYKCKYEILEAWCAGNDYLPKKLIDFILEKYVLKTQYKNVEGKELDYQKEKNKFNSIYGMSVTNMIRDEVEYSDATGEWSEIPLTNDEIIKKLGEEKKKSFLSFAYGVWITAYARNNLLKNVLKLDDHVIYCDTDSMKLTPGYNKQVIEDYNNFVKRKIKFVSQVLNIPMEKYAPKDKFGESHMLGLFDCETKKGHQYTYDRFITQGAKKYAYELDGKIHITVAGVPKKGANALKKLEDFKDDFVFHSEETGKQLLMYVDYQEHTALIDYQGVACEVTDKTGCCLVPITYVLGKSQEYSDLICESSNRAIFDMTRKEG